MLLSSVGRWQAAGNTATDGCGFYSHIYRIYNLLGLLSLLTVASRGGRPGRDDQDAGTC